jgi:hypothetical protein
LQNSRSRITGHLTSTQSGPHIAARINGRFYEAVKPLSDGNSNPPPGWGNPYQHGTMTLASPSEAVFTDSAGHRVVFKVRAGATGFKHVCG